MRLKCRYEGETRVAIVQKGDDFSQLRRRLSGDYGFEVILRYEDSDGELIILSSQHDFDDMFHVGQGSINVQVAATSSPPPTTTTTTLLLPQLKDDKSTDRLNSINSSSGDMSMSSALPTIKVPWGSSSSSSNEQSADRQQSPVPQSSDTDDAPARSPKSVRLLHSAKAVVGGMLLTAHSNAMEHMLKRSIVASNSSPSLATNGQTDGSSKGATDAAAGGGGGGSKAKNLLAKNRDISQSTSSLARPNTSSAASTSFDRSTRLVSVALAMEPLCHSSSPIRSRNRQQQLASPSSVKSSLSTLAGEFGHASYLPFLPSDPSHLDCFVAVEHCCNCSAHGFSLWHDEEKYEYLSHAALAAVVSRLALNHFPIALHAYCSRASGARIGAFEVSIALWVADSTGGHWQTHSLHSKLYSSTFPSLKKLAVGAERFLASALKLAKAVPVSRHQEVLLPTASFAALEVGSAQWRSLVAYVERVGLSIDHGGIKADESLYHPFLINRFTYRAPSYAADSSVDRKAAPLLEPYEGLHLEPPGQEDRGSVEALVRWQQRVLFHFRAL